MTQRTSLLIGEVQRVIALKSLIRPRVAVVGAVGSLIQALRDKDCTVTATDLHPDVINTTLAGSWIRDGRNTTLAAVAEADIALVTAMTLSTFTLDAILKKARESRTAIVLFAQSASHIAPHLCGDPVASVFCEQFPFYLFPGETDLRIFRARSWPA